MRPRGTFKPGQWKAECDRCGRWKHSGELRLEWTGLRVCADTCWEARHPQEFVRGKKDEQAPPWSRPKRDGIDVSPGSGNEVTEDDVA